MSLCRIRKHDSCFLQWKFMFDIPDSQLGDEVIWISQSMQVDELIK